MRAACKIFFLVSMLSMYSGFNYAGTQIVKIKIENGIYSDEIAIRFMSGATLGYDGCCDAWKLFSPNALVPQLFTRTSDGDELAVNSLPSTSTTDNVDVFVRTGTATTYSFSTTLLDSIPASASISLIDNVTGIIYDLKAMNTYVISLPAIALGSPARFGVKITIPTVLLPVELTRFEAVSAKKGTTISWTTASEVNSGSFLVERAEGSAFSGSGEMQFVPVGELAGAGNSSTETNYELTDKDRPSTGEWYYRLKQTDLNGEHRYFGPIAVTRSENSGIDISPSVSTGTFYITGDLTAPLAEIYTLTGQLVYSQRLGDLSTHVSGIIEFSDSQNGIYLLKVGSEGKKPIIQKIIISH